MNMTDAAYACVHDYPGGSESLGPRIGIKPAVLRNKVNPHNTTHHLTLNEAVRLAGVSGDNRLLQRWAHQQGFLLVPAPKGAADCCDMAVLEQVVSVAVAEGEFMHAIHSALADGHINRQEIRTIKEAERALQTAAATTTSRLEGMSDDQ